MPLNDYNIKDWIHAGNCDWQTPTKKGSTDQYFIKQFRSPRYPRDATKHPEKKRKADEWFNNRKEIFNRVSKSCGVTGSLVIPVEFFREGLCYYKITRKVDIDKGIRTDQISELPMGDRLLLLKIMCSALKHLHDQGIVHSDLKPGKPDYDGEYKQGNILITTGELGNYICKIIDFDDSYYEGQPQEDADGTPEYFSPEIIMYNTGIGNVGERVADKVTYRDQITCKSDIFTLGLIFHEYLTGKEIDKVGHNDKGDSVIYASIGGKAIFEELTLANDRLTPDLSNLLQSMVEKDYNKRPSIDEILESLKALDENGNKIGRPLPPPIDEKYAEQNPNGSYSIYKNGVRLGVIPESTYNAVYKDEFPIKGGIETHSPPIEEKYAERNTNGSYSIYQNGIIKTIIPESTYKTVFETEYPIKGSTSKIMDEKTTVPLVDEKYAERNPNGTYSIYQNGNRQGVIPETTYKSVYETDYPLRK